MQTKVLGFERMESKIRSHAFIIVGSGFKLIACLALHHHSFNNRIHLILDS